MNIKSTLCLLSVLATISVFAESKKPDVIIFLCDDFNPFYTGFAGDPDARTPHLDALAKESAVFTNSYTTSPVCMPSRTSLVTGLYPHNTGCWGNTQNLFVPPPLTPMFTDFQKAGYRTAMIGKTHWVSGKGYQREFATLDDYYRGIGIDDYQEVSATFEGVNPEGVHQDFLRKIGKYNDHRKDLVARLKEDQYAPIPSLLEPEETGDWMIVDFAEQFLKKNPTSEPFAMMLGLSNPHSPMDPSGRYAKMYDPEKISLRPNVKEFTRDGRRIDEKRLRETRAAYLAKISFLDDLLGRLIAALKERGTWDNTILVFTADHGMMIGEHGRISKGVFYEESVRMPLVIRIPGLTDKGMTTTAFAQLHDVYPTLVEAVGGTPAAGIFAKSQMPVLRSEKTSVRDAVFSEISMSRTGKLNYMVRKGEYKWFTQFGDEEHLYNLEDDPFEQNNLIESDEHQEVIADMQDRLRQFLMEEQVNFSVGYKPMEERIREKDE